MTASEDFEFRGLQFQHNGSRDPRFFPRCRPSEFSKSANHRLRLRKWHVAFERVELFEGLFVDVNETPQSVKAMLQEGASVTIGANP